MRLACARAGREPAAAPREGTAGPRDRASEPGLARDLLCLAVANVLVMACVYALAALG